MQTQTSQNSHSHTTEQLYELIERKLHLLREMQAMAIEQADLVTEHDMGGLMSVLSRKQSLMESLQTVQEELAIFKDDDPEARVWSSPQRRTACQSMVQESERLVKQLIVQENRSLDSMNLKRDSVQSQLNQNAAASQIQKAYESNMSIIEESVVDFTVEG
jgi:hypothetical protein